MNNRQTVIIDSSALIGLFNITDAHHTRALELVGIITGSSKALLPLEVLAETLNVMGKRVGKQEAAKTGNVIIAQQAKGLINFVTSTTQTITTALELQLTATGGPSFIDCLVMAHASEQQSLYIFGFDATFRKNGYRLPSKLAK